MVTKSISNEQSMSNPDLRRLVKKGRVRAPGFAVRNRSLRPHGQVGRSPRKKAQQRVTARAAEFRFANVQLRLEIEARCRAEAELDSSRSALRHCLSSLLKSQDQERAWLAGQLHEGFGQTLTGLKLMIEAALGAARNPDTGDLRKSLEAIVPLMGQSIEKLRRFGIELQPPVPEEWGVAPAIVWLCRRFADTHPLIRVKHRITVKDLDDREPFKLYLFKLYLFRILQVALEAVARRGRADRVIICLGQSSAGVELVIRDNDADQRQEPALGEERALQEWAERSGGRCRVGFQPQKGMLVQIFWPQAAG